MRRSSQEKASRALSNVGCPTIAAHTAAEDFRVGSKARETQVVFGPRDEEGANSGYPRQSREIHVSAVEQVKRPGFENQCTLPQHVVGTRGADFDGQGNRTAQIELCVQLNARFGRTELGPRKKLQRQVDGRRVQRVDRLVQIQPEVLAGIESPRPVD